VSPQNGATNINTFVITWTSIQYPAAFLRNDISYPSRLSQFSCISLIIGDCSLSFFPNEFVMLLIFIPPGISFYCLIKLTEKGGGVKYWESEYRNLSIESPRSNFLLQKLFFVIPSLSRNPFITLERHSMGLFVMKGSFDSAIAEFILAKARAQDDKKVFYSEKNILYISRMTSTYDSYRVKKYSSDYQS